jgi:hypothetical protein
VQPSEQVPEDLSCTALYDEQVKVQPSEQVPEDLSLLVDVWAFYPFVPGHKSS